MKFEWDQNDRYVSNNGSGPLLARILCATSKTVTMERWRVDGKKVHRFELPLKFFLSDRCGWKRVETEH